MLQQRGWLHKRIGLDKRGWFLPVAVYEALQAGLGTIADTAGVIEPLRAVKSAAEVEKSPSQRAMWTRACARAWRRFAAAQTKTRWSRR